jgi:hypothetical protein
MKRKNTKKRIIAMLKMLFYTNTHNVNQREALDKSTEYLSFIDYYMRLFAHNKGRTLNRGEIKSDLKNNPYENQTNDEYKFSYDKEIVM